MGLVSTISADKNIKLPAANITGSFREEEKNLTSLF